VERAGAAKVTIQTCFQTDTGVREHNEDACGVFPFPSPRGTLFLLVVADGLGGHPAGEVASSLAVRELHLSVLHGIPALPSIDQASLRALLARGFERANRAVLDYPERDPACLGMGTTMVAALLAETGEGVCGNVGDSRAYLVGDKIAQITRDHSRVQELVDRGLIDVSLAPVHPLRHIVTRIIGRAGDSPDFYPFTLGRDCLLLCSDGLLDGISESDVARIVSMTEFPHICRVLVEEARSRSRDNITVVAARRVPVVQTRRGPDSSP